MTWTKNEDEAELDIWINGNTTLERMRVAKSLTLRYYCYAIRFNCKPDFNLSNIHMQLKRHCFFNKQRTNSKSDVDNNPFLSQKCFMHATMSNIQGVMHFELWPNEILFVCFEYLGIFEIFHSFDRLNDPFYTLIRNIPLQLNFRNVRKIKFDQFY
jgi:hypothetical protein